MRKASDLTVTDQFCGAGGTSLAAKAAGARVALAMNHWKLAVETHNTNFPETLHDCVDISACDPRRYPRTDILLTSPECTCHSLAKGQKRNQQAQTLPGFGELLRIDPAAERSRATMLDVPRFAEHHQYELIIVENVVEARNWILFDEWLLMMQKLGYTWEIVYFNSMFAHPTPQSRDRMYVVFWKKGNTAPDLRFTPTAYCQHCDKDVTSVQSWKNPLKKWGRYGKGKQYVYRCPHCACEVVPYYYAAANAINWGLPIQRISERSKPLKPKTLRRIQMGLDRFATEPVLIELAHGSAMSGMIRPVTAPAPTQTTAQSVGVLSSFIVGLDHMHATGNSAHSVAGVCSTQTARQDKALVMPYLIERHGTSTTCPVSEPLSTVTAQGNHHGLVVPYLLDHLWEYRPRSVTDPLTTVVAGGNHHGLVLSPEVSSSFLVSYYGQDSLRSIVDPMGTLTTLDRHALVTPAETRPRVEDCSFRMLQPPEIGRAMAFPDTYVVLGNSREKTKQYGNAVTPPVMHMILERCIATF
jgi:DNA (cytosine-5)-methyltransferase 1